MLCSFSTTHLQRYFCEGGPTMAAGSRRRCVSAATLGVRGARFRGVQECPHGRMPGRRVCAGDGSPDPQIPRIAQDPRCQESMQGQVGAVWIGAHIRHGRVWVDMPWRWQAPDWPLMHMAAPSSHTASITVPCILIMQARHAVRRVATPFGREPSPPADADTETCHPEMSVPSTPVRT